MKQILVPINLRSDYENLMKYVVSVGTKSQAKITLFYAGGKRILKGGGKAVFQRGEDFDQFSQGIKHNRIHQSIESICQTLVNANIDFNFKFVPGRSFYEIIRETRRSNYDLVIMGTHAHTGWRGYLSGALASKVTEEVSTPVFVVPARSKFNEIEHITYAVDLTDYDPRIIQQVKSIASLFDAKLSITHVNREGEDEREQYLLSLERTIADTIDYPKIYYKFFDHADPMRGLIKFVDLNNSNLIAMINRKKFSWKTIFSNDHMTREVSRRVSVPVLAFNKY